MDNGFVQFYRHEHEGQVRRAYLMLGSSAAAHDVVAEAFLVVLQRWETIDVPGPYLSRCVLNGCHDSHRRRAREELQAEPSPLDRLSGHKDPAEDLVDPADEMATALLTLPFRQRAAIVLRYYGGLNTDEIAAELGCRAGTVGSLTHRGMATLRTALERQQQNPKRSGRGAGR